MIRIRSSHFFVIWVFLCPPPAYLSQDLDYDYSATEIFADLGANVTLPCPKEVGVKKSWIRAGKERTGNTLILEDGSLFLSDLKKNDTGIYDCIKELDNDNVEDNIECRIHLLVRSTPAALQNVTVIPSSILATLQWSSVDDGGYPIINITVRYRDMTADGARWQYVDSKYITLTAVDVYKLNPNTTYLFQIWATNKLGPGDITSISTRTTYNSEEIELARHFLNGAETFDTRTWIVAVSVVMATLIILTVGTCCVLYHDLRMPSCDEDPEKDPEKIELIPHIVSNPYISECPEKLRKSPSRSLHSQKSSSPVRV